MKLQPAEIKGVSDNPREYVTEDANNKMQARAIFEKPRQLGAKPTINLSAPKHIQTKTDDAEIFIHPVNIRGPQTDPKNRTKLVPNWD
jgi:hypothetical protein